ncbi:MAG: ATP--guanido phosphotransferase [Clostridiales bacterium]|nr:ATP--guanido phosphotransferase [Clostridiales bacterium]
MAHSPEFIETIVISTRIRLARNFASYPFPKKMDDAQAEDVVYLVGHGLGEFDSVDTFTKYDIKNLTPLQKAQLQEEYLISPALTKSKNGAAFVSKDRTISIMVNEEDHLREQYICKGFDLFKAYERISGIDDALAGMYDFAFDDKLGYLTACPSNLGTGMRASVMMFLPGLVWSGELKKFLPVLKAGGLTVRGSFGEGTGAEGYVYQVSNERTLGVSETDILSEMVRMTMTLCDLEIRARERMLATDEMQIRDRCLRSYGILTNCAVLGWTEFLDRMADVRLGAALGVFEVKDKKRFDEFMDDMRPTAFRINNGLVGESEELCDMLRAETASGALPTLVRVTRRKR